MAANCTNDEGSGSGPRHIAMGRTLLEFRQELCIHTSALILLCLFLVAACSEASPRAAAPAEVRAGGGGTAAATIATDRSIGHSGSNKQPRGYCTPISRAILQESRCYEHLVVPTKSDSSSGGIDNDESRDNVIAVTTNVFKEHSSSSDSKRSHRQQEKKEAEGDQEELVYVRLETIGSNIRNLSTQAINERLLVGVFEQLFGGAATTTTQPASKSKVELTNREQNAASPAEVVLANNNDNHDDSDSLDVRAQILSSSASLEGRRLAERCKHSIERFVCRMAYPSCHFRRADVSALVRPPCREDCLLVRDVFCSNLDWQKFATVLSRAVNITLRSAINALDLESQGDLVEFVAAAPTVRAENGAHNESADEMATGAVTATTFDVLINSHLLNYNLNSSIHLYWPHEHSIQRCESLPPLRYDKQLQQQHHSGNHNYNPAGHTPNATSTLRWRRRSNGPLNIHSSSLRNSSSAPYKHHRTVRWPICSNAHLTGTRMFLPNPLMNKKRPTDDGRDDDCISSIDGSDYQGEKNHTRSGLECQSWISQKPHQHTSSELLFDNMRGAHNYCRNPGAMELKPWCYTNDPNIRWEYCDIKSC